MKTKLKASITGIWIQQFLLFLVLESALITPILFNALILNRT
jgi:hypothetical protein